MVLVIDICGVPFLQFSWTTPRPPPKQAIGIARAHQPVGGRHHRTVIHLQPPPLPHRCPLGKLGPVPGRKSTQSNPNPICRIRHVVEPFAMCRSQPTAAVAQTQRCIMPRPVSFTGSSATMLGKFQWPLLRYTFRDWAVTAVSLLLIPVSGALAALPGA